MQNTNCTNYFLRNFLEYPTRTLIWKDHLVVIWIVKSHSSHSLLLLCNLARIAFFGNALRVLYHKQMAWGKNISRGAYLLVQQRIGCLKMLLRFRLWNKVHNYLNEYNYPSRNQGPHASLIQFARNHQIWKKSGTAPLEKNDCFILCCEDLIDPVEFTTVDDTRWCPTRQEQWGNT